ncbi:hypothetical protein [Kineococcus aurantiacus]|uniref:Uncharacterized protein n=1 Tax=Kineococcus aurantiacus TaxID=37633 RepID=A0A7Y9J133_9ACTN|nr:hypothetical protein [Kineococcus aurantiacus]NYD22791.1 hypothetical protein [Kineococcus aurantiacus]
MLSVPALLTGRRRAAPAADPVLRAYLNEQLAAATGLGEQLRRASTLEVLLPERTTLLRVRREVAADRAALRTAMRRLGASTDWAVVGVSWLSAHAARLTPLLHRLPVVDRVAGALPAPHPTREAVVEGLIALEDVLGGLHRRAVAAGLLGELVAAERAEWAAGVRGLAARARAQRDEVEAAHRRCAQPLLRT